MYFACSKLTPSLHAALQQQALQLLIKHSARTPGTCHHQVNIHLASRAARFCNGAAHGGQVVGPATIVPGLLQAWGCEKVPEGQGPATFAKVTDCQGVGFSMIVYVFWSCCSQ